MYSFSSYSYLFKSMYILSVGTEELVRMSFPVRFSEYIYMYIPLELRL